jgi:hypothetical protein
MKLLVYNYDNNIYLGGLSHMKMRKIIAGLSAMAIAVSMLSAVSVSAEETAKEPAYTSSVTLEGKDWWNATNPTVSELLGSISIDDVDYIEFTSECDNLVIGYNSMEVTDEDSGSTWKQSSVVPYTVSGSDIKVDDNYCVMIGVSKDDGADYTVSWSVYTKEDTSTAATDVVANKAYIQYTAAKDGVKNARAVMKISESDAESYKSVSVVFNNGTEDSKAVESTSCYKTIKAAGEEIAAGDGYVFVAVEVENIPEDVTLTPKFTFA